MTTSTMIALGLAALVLGYALYTRAGNTSPAAARELVAAGAGLLDVRTPEEFNEGHIAGATNIPLQELQRRVAELETKTRPIVVYCRSGNRSAQAAKLLQAAGYTSVHNLGAMSRW